MDLKQMVETLRKEGFTVSHNLHCIEEAADGCSEPDRPVSEFDWFQLMDRACQQFEHFNNAIGNCHALCSDEKSRKLGDEISSKMYALYQHAGHKFFELQTEKQLDAAGDALDRDR